MRLFLANAYFELRSFSECQRILNSAIHQLPQCALLWYNLAIVCEESAVFALREYARHDRASAGLTPAQAQQQYQRWVASLRDACADLRAALAVFRWLSAPKLPTGLIPSCGGLKYHHLPEHVTKHVERCTRVLGQATAAAAEAAECEKQEAARR
jgi:hypothetical protein